MPDISLRAVLDTPRAPAVKPVQRSTRVHAQHAFGQGALTAGASEA